METYLMVLNKERPDAEHHRSRYLAPETPVAERIDELILEEQGREDVLLARQQQAEWLKRVMASHWGAHLPQPFIGFDLDEDRFIASWQSDSGCNTLAIDAGERKGWYDPWPAGEGDNPIPEEIDLDTEGSVATPADCPHDNPAITTAGPYYRQVHPNNFQNGQALPGSFILHDTGCHFGLSLHDGRALLPGIHAEPGQPLRSGGSSQQAGASQMSAVSS